jgi:hypothetical protein
VIEEAGSRRRKEIELRGTGGKGGRGRGRYRRLGSRGGGRVKEEKRVLT